MTKRIIQDQHDPYERRDVSIGEAIQMVTLGFIAWCDKCKCYHVVETHSFRNVDAFLAAHNDTLHYTPMVRVRPA